MPSRSFTACRNRCLHPRYFSVVCTETWPSKNWICSNSPPESWQNRAHDLLRSCGASFKIPSFPAYSFTACQTTFSVIFVPQTTPLRQTHRKTRPWVTCATLMLSPNFGRRLKASAQSDRPSPGRSKYLSAPTQNVSSYLQQKRRKRWTTTRFASRTFS